MSTGMSAIPLLARRFLLSRASDGFISFIAWVSVIGIALGVLALIVVTSVINGFEGELTRAITGVYGDVVLYSRGEPIADHATVEGKIRRTIPEIEALSASFVAELMVSGPGGVAGAVVEGVDTATFSSVMTVNKKIISGRMMEKENEITIGSALAERIGVSEGSEIQLIIPFTAASVDDLTELSGPPKAVSAKVVGIIKMGMHEYDSKFLFAPLNFVQEMAGYPGRITSFKMKLRAGSDSSAAAALLSDAFGYPFRAKDWSLLNKNLFYAIRLEKVVIGILLAVIVIVAAFNVVSTLMMMIHDKAKEISILKALGFGRSQNFLLFCLIGGGMGAIGVACGIVMGIALSWLISRMRIVDLPADIYYIYISSLPVVIRWDEILFIALVAMIISFAATLYPAWKISRRAPLEGLRYE
ncbi:MAG: ABC transporter permease [Bdellovibrionota bacterium]